MSDHYKRSATLSEHPKILAAARACECEEFASDPLLMFDEILAANRLGDFDGVLPPHAASLEYLARRLIGLRWSLERARMALNALISVELIHRDGESGAISIPSWSDLWRPALSDRERARRYREMAARSRKKAAGGTPPGPDDDPDGPNGPPPKPPSRPGRDGPSRPRHDQAVTPVTDDRHGQRHDGRHGQRHDQSVSQSVSTDTPLPPERVGGRTTDPRAGSPMLQTLRHHGIAAGLPVDRRAALADSLESAGLSTPQVASLARLARAEGQKNQGGGLLMHWISDPTGDPCRAALDRARARDLEREAAEARQKRDAETLQRARSGPGLQAPTHLRFLGPRQVGAQ